MTRRLLWVVPASLSIGLGIYLIISPSATGSTLLDAVTLVAAVLLILSTLLAVGLTKEDD